MMDDNLSQSFRWYKRPDLRLRLHQSMKTLIVLVVFFFLLFHSKTTEESNFYFTFSYPLSTLPSHPTMPSKAIYVKSLREHPFQEKEQVNKITPVEIKAIITPAYEQWLENFPVKFPSETLKNLYEFALSLDTLHRLRYSWGMGAFNSQKSPHLLMYGTVGTERYQEYVKRIRKYPDSAFSKVRFLRILISTYTAAHYFQIPYPTLFCLFFQESKFNFEIISPTGAKGIGQLTDIGVSQVKERRTQRWEELRLQMAIKHLQKIYADPVITKVLALMNLNVELPTLHKLPLLIHKPSLHSIFYREVHRELDLLGYTKDENYLMIRRLSIKVGQGAILPERYAMIHKAYTEVIERRYAAHVGNVFHIETNILISAMLLRHYYKYPWTLDGTEAKLTPPVRAMLAVAAYNHGETRIKRFLRYLTTNYPWLDLGTLSLQELSDFFNRKDLVKGLGISYRKTKEVHQHARQVMNCSESVPLFQ
ncbi:transglycosylase SLT domain-containing protein [Deltaproteobacteria bacterium TL4]